jgi:HAD superfamily hydrolase (TIGR01509 family)
MPVAVVSNNSAVAIEAYLTAYDLAANVTPIIGRAYADPKRMKPDPTPVLDAALALGAVPESCVLVGDSLSNIEAARAAGSARSATPTERGRSTPFAAADIVIMSTEDIV